MNKDRYKLRNMFNRDIRVYHSVGRILLSPPFFVKVVETSEFWNCERCQCYRCCSNCLGPCLPFDRGDKRAVSYVLFRLKKRKWK